MQHGAEHTCKIVSEQNWSLSTFMQFYERVLSPRLFHPYGRLLAQEIRKDVRADAAPADILEVACGTGVITAHLYEDLAKPLNLKLVATDLSRIAVNVAKSVLSRELQRDVALLADVDMADLPFPDNSFDIIVCGFGLMFPPDKARVAKEFKRVLRPGGRIYATVFHYNQLFDLARQLSRKYFGMPSRIMDAALSLADPSPITRAFSIEGLAGNGEDLATLRPLSFSLDEPDIREFLFNVCILLEEFNQCDTGSREKYLDTMIQELRAQAPGHCYQVNAWMLRGQLAQDGKASVASSASPDFSVLDAFRRLTPVLAEPGAHCAQPMQDSPLLQSFHAMKALFLAAHPEYPESEVETMRQQEYSRLDDQQATYLDHVGGTLPPESLLERDFQMLKRTILGNPHSDSKESQAAHARAREEIYKFFRCSPDEYEIVFTANASGAIRLVAESFPFQPNSEVLLTKDNHTSVHGLREYARAKGASVKYIPLDENLLIHDELMRRSLQRLRPGAPHLLAFPAQSNATGARHELEWIRRAQERGAMVLCDTAAFVPQSRLDCSVHRPDFIAVSFYKIFGYPTGAGCLIARRSSLHLLAPPSFAGGAVCYYSGPWSPTDRLLYHDDERRFEVGTPNYAAFHAIAQGFEFISRLGGIEEVARRSTALARWLESSLSGLRHDVKGLTPLCRIYGPPAERKGATIMLNFFDCYGSTISHARIKRAAEAFGITVRNGCFCNLGAVQQATYATAGAEHCELDKTERIMDCHTFDEKILEKGDCGAVRVSFGLGSNFADAYRFYLFATCLLNTEGSRLEDGITEARLS